MIWSDKWARCDLSRWRQKMNHVRSSRPRFLLVHRNANVLQLRCIDYIVEPGVQFVQVYRVRDAIFHLARHFLESFSQMPHQRRPRVVDRSFSFALDAALLSPLFDLHFCDGSAHFRVLLTMRVGLSTTSRRFGCSLNPKSFFLASAKWDRLPNRPTGFVISRIWKS